MTDDALEHVHLDRQPSVRRANAGQRTESDPPSDNTDFADRRHRDDRDDFSRRSQEPPRHRKSEADGRSRDDRLDYDPRNRERRQSTLERHYPQRNDDRHRRSDRDSREDRDDRESFNLSKVCVTHTNIPPQP